MAELPGLCIVIGAGLSGLTAAHQLAQVGQTVLVLDKGRGVGGRLATRRIGAGVFDHGAQFFTTRDENFTRLAAEWQAAGMIREWSRGFARDGAAAAADGHARYYAPQGMTAIAKHLAAGLDVRTSARANTIRPASAGWEIELESGEVLKAGAVILTAPVPQSLMLLETGGVAINPAQLAALQAVSYEPCLAVLALLDKPSRIPEPGGMQFTSGALRFLADNQRKGISPQAAAVTIHASPDFSRVHYDASDAEVSQMLLAAAEPWLGAAVTHSEVKRWRYARPESPIPETCLEIQPSPPLILAGDAFGGARVEGAALSGLAAAQRLLQI
jgi:hypothetical protein